jgi:hypothetical protein
MKTYPARVGGVIDVAAVVHFQFVNHPPSVALPYSVVVPPVPLLLSRVSVYDSRFHWAYTVASLEYSGYPPVVYPFAESTFVPPLFAVQCPAYS